MIMLDNALSMSHKPVGILQQMGIDTTAEEKGQSQFTDAHRTKRHKVRWSREAAIHRTHAGSTSDGEPGAALAPHSAGTCKNYF